MSSTMLAGLDARALHFTNETFTRLVYRRVVRAGDTVLDLGANEGLHTRELSRLVGSGGCVHAFEPNTRHFTRLLAIGENVTLWPFALGRTLGVATLHVPEGLDGWASLEELAGAVGDRRIREVNVVQVPLDALSLGAEGRVSFVKIDVEHRELDAIEGALGFLGAHRPVIVAENVTGEILRALAPLGYSGVDYFGTPLTESGGVCGPDRLANGLLLPPGEPRGAALLHAGSAEVQEVLARAHDGTFDPARTQVARRSRRGPFGGVATALGRLFARRQGPRPLTPSPPRAAAP